MVIIYLHAKSCLCVSFDVFGLSHEDHNTLKFEVRYCKGIRNK